MQDAYLKLILQTQQSGRLFQSLPLFFLRELWYNYLDKSTRPLEEAQEGGYLPASPVLYRGMKKAVAR